MAKLRKRTKAHKPDEANPAFIMARLEMLDCVAYWTLKPIERSMLTVLEIEHMRHGGVENGKLIVTRRQFEKRGIHKDAIAPGLRAIRALGFVDMQRGAAGIGDQAQAHRFRLTYVQPAPTDEWRKHHNADRAHIDAEAARADVDVRARRLGLRSAQKQNAGPENGTGLVRKTGPGPTSVEAKMASIGPENGTGPGPENGTTIYISGDRGSVPDEGHDAPTSLAPRSSPPPFDLIEGSFRIGDRRIELRRPVAAADGLTAGQLAQQLAASHPSNADALTPPQQAVDVGRQSPTIAAE